MRFALHILTGRREDRLLFDHQITLAEMLGYEDATYTLAVEQLMQRYYRTVMELSRLNEMLLQLFEEAILMDPKRTANRSTSVSRSRTVSCRPLTTRFSSATRPRCSKFSCCCNKTRHSRRQRLHHRAHQANLAPDRRRVPPEPAQSPPVPEILRAPEGVTHELRRMNLYGVLGLYIPAFGRIVGRMQYDLFHAYTVDEHTLFVVSNLRRFALQRYDDEFPHCSPIMQSLEKPEIAYLAGLFHDIAKGRGGDHSELGAVDAESFCLEHGLSNTMHEPWRGWSASPDLVDDSAEERHR